MKITALDHVVLHVADVERSIGFYHGILGMPVERLDEFRRGDVPFPSIRVSADSIIDLFPNDSGERNAVVDHICLVTDSPISEVQSVLGSAGVAIQHGPVENFGARGTATSVYVLDPDGNRVELRNYAA